MYELIGEQEQLLEHLLLHELSASVRLALPVVLAYYYAADGRREESDGPTTSSNNVP